MPIDPYALCPGGTGKKIKFCCPDLFSEWERIQRMLDGEQFVGCLQALEQLEKERPDRACLLAVKASVLRAAGQIEAAQAVAARFLEKFPDNPFALAEKAVLTAVTEGGRQAMPFLQQAIAAEDGALTTRCFEAIEVTAQALLAQGHLTAARALFAILLQADPEDRAAAEMMLRINRVRSVPLLVREGRALATRADGAAPWKPALDEAIARVGRARWAEAAGQFATLASQYPGEPSLWWNLAVLREWLADVPGCVEALRRYAALDVPYDDAVEAEALALFLSDDPLGDRRPVYLLTYIADDLDQLQAAAALTRQVVRSPVDPASLAGEDGPPPRTIYVLLDRPLPASAEGLALADVPDVLATAALFGRQTDREARLEVHDVAEAALGEVQDLLGRLVGQGLMPGPTSEQVGEESVSYRLIDLMGFFPPDTDPRRAHELTRGLRSERIFTRWPDVPLGSLGGQTPRQAAADPAYSVRLSAALVVLEHWAERPVEPMDLDPLRRQLGLPLPGPVDPETMPVRSAPLRRLARLDVAKLSDEDLVSAFERAMAFDFAPAMNRFGRAMIDRPSMAGRDGWLVACHVAARTDCDLDRAVQLVERGRAAAVERGMSSASWDLLELSLRFARGEPDEAGRVLRHIEQEHAREPGVAESVTRMLMEVGLIGPDGAPAVPRRTPAAEPAAPEPGKLWTPGAESAGGEKKLWVPGMS